MSGFRSDARRQPASRCVLDDLALLALLNREPGHGLVGDALTEGAMTSTADFSEVLARPEDAGLVESVIGRLSSRRNLMEIWMHRTTFRFLWLLGAVDAPARVCPSRPAGVDKRG